MVKNIGLDHKKIVIAGGNGFLGISLATQFASEGARVTILSRSKPKLAVELALYGRYVISTRLAREGFTFQFPHLEAALCDIYGNRQKRGSV